MNEVRVSGLSTYKPFFTAMATGCSGMTCTYDWAGSGSTTTTTILSEAAGVTAAGNAMVNNLPQFVWIPGMFMAAKDQTTYLAGASDILSAHGTSTSGSRAAVYGTAGNVYVEGIYKGNNSAQNVVARLIIDDSDATNLTVRNAMVTSGNAQAGAACGVHSDNEKVCTIVLGTGYVTSTAYASCTAPAAAAAAPVSGAMALASAAAAAGTLAFLF